MQLIKPAGSAKRQPEAIFLYFFMNKHASSYLRLDSDALCEVNDSYDYACITLGAKSDSIFPFDLCFAPSGHFKGGI